MGKKCTRTGGSVGRAVINARQSLPAAKRKRNKLDKLKSDEYDVNKVVDMENGFAFKSHVIHSVTEQSDLDDFLIKAQLAGTEFTAQRANLSLLNAEPTKLIGSTTALKEDRRKLAECQEKYNHLLTIPRRPCWKEGMRTEELHKMENEAFLAWRRKLAELEENEQVLLTPFERNIEIWRQLWRVLERSDIDVQILDARDPLLFRSEDLEKYASELEPRKINVSLLNKADFLTAKQRRIWCQFFNQRKLRVVFWSAIDLLDKNVAQKLQELRFDQTMKDPVEEETEEAKEVNVEEESDSDVSVLNKETTDNFTPNNGEGIDVLTPQEDSERFLRKGEEVAKALKVEDFTLNKPDLMSKEQLIEYFESLRAPLGLAKHELLTVGMVGYPNVGKSSTINKLMCRKKVAVSATPGKTKHFQTLYLEPTLMLCDCPGLVMPSLTMSKAQMCLSGILAADQMRQYEPVVQLVCTLLPQFVFERAYGLTFSKESGSHNADSGSLQQHTMARPSDLMTLYAFVRGFMSPKGLPDCSRAARALVKDFINGKLLYRHAPPTCDQWSFDHFDDWLKKPLSCASVSYRTAESTDTCTQSRETGHSVNHSELPIAKQINQPERKMVSETLLTVQKRNLLVEDESSVARKVDGSFFDQLTSQAHVLTVKKPVTSQQIGEKPPKKMNKNKKRDKLRRVYKHLDA